MKNLFILSIITLFIFSSCRKDEFNDVKPEKLKWRYQLETIDSDIGASIHDPIVYEDMVIIPRESFQGSKAELIALNKHTGKLVWTWSEAYDNYNKDGFSGKSYVHDGILAIADNNYSAGLNIKTGETLWENIENIHGLTLLTGVDDQIFKTAYIPNQKYWLLKASIYTGEWEAFYHQDEIPDYRLDTYSPRAIEWQGKTYVGFHEIHWLGPPTYETNYFYNLFNITDNKFEWRTDTIPINHPNSHVPSVFPAFEDGQILLGNDAIYSYNISDGKLKWKNSYDNSTTIGADLATANGKVYANKGYEFLVCLDVHTGNEIFRTPTGGSPSTIEIHDGNVYMSAVTTFTHNQIMVIDANNGTVKHALRSPYDQVDEEAVLQWALAVDKETGLAYTADYKNVLCYDFN